MRTNFQFFPHLTLLEERSRRRFREKSLKFENNQQYIAMIVPKIIETQLDLNDPNDILDPNLMGMCMRLLTKKFVGRCFKSCLIIKINKILLTSSRYMSEALGGSAYIAVRFEVDGMVFSRGEIINGCRILKIDSDGRIHARSAHAGLQIRHSDVIYEEGQIVPLIIQRVAYNPAQTAVSIEASPLVPTFLPLEVFKITSGLTVDDTEQAKYLFARLDALLDTIAARIKKEPSEKNAFDFFQGLLYPFKKKTENKLKGFTPNSLRLIGEVQSGYVYQPAESDICAQEYYHAVQYDGESFEKNTMFVLEILLNRAIQYYASLIEFVNTYPTFEKVDKIKGVWRAYNLLKR